VTEPEAEDAKLVTLARATRVRVGAAEGAAVRDLDGRIYAASTVGLPSLALSALEAAVVAAVSSGAQGVDAAAVVTAVPDGEPAGLAALRDLSGRDILVLVAGSDGMVRQTLVVSGPRRPVEHDPDRQLAETEPEQPRADRHREGEPHRRP
jgi:hypothetical protein